MWDLILSVPGHCLSFYFTVFLRVSEMSVFMVFVIDRLLGHVRSMNCMHQIISYLYVVENTHWFLLMNEMTKVNESC